VHAVGAALLLATGAKAQAPAVADSTRIPNPPVGWSGVFWASMSVATDSASTAVNGGHERTQFNLDRLYLTLRLPINQDAFVRVTTDISASPPSQATSPRGWALRVKYAYLHYDLWRHIGGVEGLTLAGRIGILHTVAIDHEEQYWARYLTATAIERDGFFSSADAGAALMLTLPKRMGELYATVTNGPGFQSPEVDHFKDYALRATFTPFATDSSWLSGLVISPWVYVGRTASLHENDVAPATLGPVDGGLRRDRWGLFVANRYHPLTFGVDLATRTETFEAGANTVASPRIAADSSGRLTGAWMLVRPTELAGDGRSRWGIIGRYDHFVPNTASTGGVSGATPVQLFSVAGLFVEPNPRTTVALDWQHFGSLGYAPAFKPPEGNLVMLHVQATF
jgi:hypothetical protein